MGVLIVKRRTNIHLEWLNQISRRHVVSGCRAVAVAVDDQINRYDSDSMLKALSKPSACFCLQLCHGDTTSYLWHLRLGHIGYGGLTTIVTKGFGTGIKLTSVRKWELCDGCDLGKQTRMNIMKYSPNRARKYSKSSTATYVVRCRPQHSVASPTSSLSLTRIRTTVSPTC